MDVVAISVPTENGWRWRIVGYAGEVVDQSRETFATIAAALASGASHLPALDTPPPTTARGWARPTSRFEGR